MPTDFSAERDNIVCAARSSIVVALRTRAVPLLSQNWIDDTDLPIKNVDFAKVSVFVQPGLRTGIHVG